MAEEKNTTDNKGKTGAPEQPVLKKTYGRRFIILIASGAAAALGATFFVIYFFNQNMTLGTIGVFLGIAGGFTFKHFWGKNQGADLVSKTVGGVPKKQVNSLCIYKNRVVFEDFEKPDNYAGFFWTCKNDGKAYYVNWENPDTGNKEPFALPDQQYYDPGVFAERVLSLPAHRKLFRKKVELLQKLRPLFLFVVAAGIWLLILTTTGGG